MTSLCHINSYLSHNYLFFIMRFSDKQWIVNILLMCGSISLTIGGVEVFLRITHQYETFDAATELSWMRNNPQDLSQYFTIDPDIGFCPILGVGGYTEYGTSPNKYPLEKRPEITRMLFIGDSVTARGKIVEAIRRHYDDEAFEYWNAGVESFNTVQEVKFYQRYNAAIQPDHVILTFHLNDFEPTPVAFFNEKKQLVVYVPHTPLKRVNRWLFEKSYLYRWILGITLRPGQGRGEIAEEVQQYLQILRDELNSQQIRLTVLILPLLKPFEQWSQEEQDARHEILRIVQHLNIRYVDLYEPFQQAMAAGITVQDSPGDTWHPSSEVAKIFAEYMAGLRLLEE